MSLLGKTETNKLKQNLESQLNRLVEQLADLEKCRDELDTEEYEETKEDTIAQLKELNETLEKLVKGDISLVTTLGEVQLAIQSAISEAFKTPEVKGLFGKRDVEQLRKQLDKIDKDVKYNKLDASAGDAQKIEILTELRHLNVQLKTEELKLLEKFKDQPSFVVDFVKIDD